MKSTATLATYQTTDIALASYLVIRGYSIVNVTHNQSNKATFHFQDKPEREHQVLEFFNRQAVVEPVGFVDYVKSLKAMISGMLTSHDTYNGLDLDLPGFTS